MSWGWILTILPYAFQLVSFILDKVKADQSTIAAFQDLIQKSRNNGLISQQASDKFQDLHEKLMQRFKEPQNVPIKNDNKGGG